MDQKINLLKSELGEIRIKENYDLSYDIQTSKKGIARAFYIATSTIELIKVVTLSHDLNIDYVILGSGSKYQYNFEDSKKLFIKNRVDSLKIFGIKGKITKDGLGIEGAMIEAGSGVSLKRLAEYSLSQGLVGLENMAGVLGTIGGSLHTNADLREKISSVEVLRQNLDVEQRSLNEVGRDDIILKVIFKLKSRKND